MDENEYTAYLENIERMRSADLGEAYLIEKVYDPESYMSVPGCYHVLPAPTEE
jgi:hypothetical protein